MMLLLLLLSCGLSWEVLHGIVLLLQKPPASRPRTTAAAAATAAVPAVVAAVISLRLPASGRCLCRLLLAVLSVCCISRALLTLLLLLMGLTLVECPVDCCSTAAAFAATVLLVAVCDSGYLLLLCARLLCGV